MPEITSLHFEVRESLVNIALQHYENTSAIQKATLQSCGERASFTIKMMRFKKRTDPKTPDSHGQGWMQLVNVTSPPRDEDFGDSDAEQTALNYSRFSAFHWWRA
ncbi:hypothetical protein E4U39_001176 [Claviceps sp. Clav50 group G5]|nr:hypothetical protein E4U39_001176 [Claviceps sp. Clav50 group G5]